jgi:hypothetical protein
MLRYCFLRERDAESGIVPDDILGNAETSVSLHVVRKLVLLGVRGGFNFKILIDRSRGTCRHEPKQEDEV